MFSIPTCFLSTRAGIYYSRITNMKSRCVNLRQRYIYRERGEATWSRLSQYNTQMAGHLRPRKMRFVTSCTSLDFTRAPNMIARWAIIPVCYDVAIGTLPILWYQPYPLIQTSPYGTICTPVKCTTTNLVFISVQENHLNTFLYQLIMHNIRP